MRRLYTLLICLAAPIAFVILLWRGLRDRDYWQGLGERFGFGRARPGDEPSIWVHAVSLGEVTAAAPLLHELQRRHPETPLVLTCATPTGRARGVALFEGSVEIEDRVLKTHQGGVLGSGDTISVKAGKDGARFLVLAAKPIKEPVVQYGPFVMNTRAEIEQAIRDYQSGELIR